MRKILLTVLVFLVVSTIAWHTGKRPAVSTNYIQYSTTTSGMVVCDDVGTDMVVIHEAATLVLGLTVQLPATPADAQRVTILSVNGITALAMTTPVGSITSLLGTLVSGGAGTYIYSAARNKWYRIR